MSCSHFFESHFAKFCENATDGHPCQKGGGTKIRLNAHIPLHLIVIKEHAHTDPKSALACKSKSHNSCHFPHVQPLILNLALIFWIKSSSYC